MSVFKRWNGTTWEIIGPNISSTRFDNINNMIAQEFDPKSTYNIDNYVIKNDKLYKCINKISVQKSWDINDWKEIKIGQDITELKNDIVIVDDIQPTSKNNKIWIKPNDVGIQIPLVEDVMMLPSPNNYGENNQIPRSTGTGIEWVDYGLPSNQQTENAINSWLNAHPEATTTVQDSSIGENKLIDNTISDKKINDELKFAINSVQTKLNGIRVASYTDIGGQCIVFNGTNFVTFGNDPINHDREIHYWLLEPNFSYNLITNNTGIIGHPNGAIFINNLYYIVDSDNSKIYILNIDFQLIQTISSPTGSSFISIAYDNDNDIIYVQGYINRKRYIAKLINNEIESQVIIESILSSVINPSIVTQNCFYYNGLIYIICNQPNILVGINPFNGNIKRVISFDEGDGFYPYGELEGGLIYNELIEGEYKQYLYLITGLITTSSENTTGAVQIFKMSWESKVAGNSTHGQNTFTSKIMYIDNTITRSINPDGSSENPFTTLGEAAAVFQYQYKNNNWYSSILIKGNYEHDSIKLQNVNIGFRILPDTQINSLKLQNCIAYIDRGIFNEITLGSCPYISISNAIIEHCTCTRSILNSIKSFISTMNSNGSIINGNLPDLNESNTFISDQYTILPKILIPANLSLSTIRSSMHLPIIARRQLSADSPLRLEIHYTDLNNKENGDIECANVSNIIYLTKEELQYISSNQESVPVVYINSSFTYPTKTDIIFYKVVYTFTNQYFTVTVLEAKYLNNPDIVVTEKPTLKYFLFEHC